MPHAIAMPMPCFATPVCRLLLLMAMAFFDADVIRHAATAITDVATPYAAMRTLLPCLCFITLADAAAMPRAPFTRYYAYAIRA